ncbi:MAG: adenosylmethionine decarboxylase [Desulfobacterium sp.]|nr:adenosylmethionine decarboxylase [Desulfobacterium sp.]
MLENDKNSDDEPKQDLFALGRQLTIEYYDCEPKALLDPDRVEAIFLKAAHASNATVINSSFHKFDPQGVSGVVIIAESHFTVHAWPEHNYAAVDIFTCGDSIDLKKAVDSLADSLGSDNVVVSSDKNRGLIPYASEEKTADDLVPAPGHYPISWKKEVEDKAPWGVLTSVDLYDCDPGLIRDEAAITRYVTELCDLIEMKRFGPCQVVHFGEDERVSGFSMTQLIETSLVSGHFANASNTAYLDIFSCKYYDPRQVAEFSLAFFKGTNYKMHLALRQ